MAEGDKDTHKNTKIHTSSKYRWTDGLKEKTKDRIVETRNRKGKDEQL